MNQRTQLTIALVWPLVVTGSLAAYLKPMRPGTPAFSSTDTMMVADSGTDEGTPTPASGNLRPMNGIFPQPFENPTIFADNERRKPAIIVDKDSATVHMPKGMVAGFYSSPSDSVILSPGNGGGISFANASTLVVRPEIETVFQDAAGQKLKVPQLTTALALLDANLQITSVTMRSTKVERDAQVPTFCNIEAQATCPEGFVALATSCGYEGDAAHFAQNFSGNHGACRFYARYEVSSIERSCTKDWVNQQLHASITCLSFKTHSFMTRNDDALPEAVKTLKLKERNAVTAGDSDPIKPRAEVH